MTLPFTEQRTYIMGILNVTPDSFSDGGKYLHPEKAIAQAYQLKEEGADIIDIGAESSRPGAELVSEEEELRRIIPVVKEIGTRFPLSVDTYKSKVAQKCLELGATIINDITGLREQRMREIIAYHHAIAVISHMQGTPKTMQQRPYYADVVLDIKAYLAGAIQEAQKSGIENIIIDPGIGFGKTLEHNLAILRNLDEFTTLGYPLLVGTSRKGFIGKICEDTSVQRLEGTIASICVAVMNGAKMVRVHDVAECRKALKLVDAIRSG